MVGSEVARSHHLEEPHPSSSTPAASTNLRSPALRASFGWQACPVSSSESRRPRRLSAEAR
jgi:hypothetical protein